MMTRPAGWIDWPHDDCEQCGHMPLVLTAAEQRDGGVWVGDGDPVMCPECEARGWISCDAETDPWVIWEDEVDQQEGDDE